MYQLQTGSERSACCCSFSLNTRIGLSRNGSHGTSTLLLGEGMGQVLLGFHMQLAALGVVAAMGAAISTTACIGLFPPILFLTV